MNKYYVGQLSRAVTHLNVEDKPAKVELAFKNGDFNEEMPFKLDHEYYVIEKSELDACMARKEHLEQMNCTPVWDAYNRLTEINKALGEENSKLAEENKALVERNAKLKTRLDKIYGMTPVGEELRAANEKLAAEVAELKEKIKELGIIKKTLEVGNEKWIRQNTELAKQLTDECKEWDAECNDWKARYAKVNNELFQKGLAYSTLEGAYKNEKIAGEMLLKDRDALKARIEKLEAELTEIKTARTLREAYIAGVEKGCESLSEELNEAKKKVEELEKKIKRLEDDNSAKADALVNAKDRGDYWLREHHVKSLMYQELEQKHDAKWTAMCDALKGKGVEVIYMGEEDSKPIVDVKIPKLDELKSKKISTCSLEAGADGKLTFIYTYVDGHNEAAHINYLCKNHVDTESISCGTVPKCKSCAHYMHKGEPFAGRWCYKAVHKEGPKFISKLSKEEAEGPACSDFKTRKE